MIYGLRVKQAREMRKLTQTELAERVGVAQSTIAKMEADIREWPTQLVEAIALQTGFPIGFFQQGIGPEFSLGSLLFRCRASLSSQEKAHLCQFGLLTFELAEKMAMARKAKPIELHLPSLRDEDPASAAQLTRATMGLPPDTPIPHLVNKLERNGIYIFSIPQTSEKFDAFSLWPDTEPRKPVMIIASAKPGDRLRYNCAHELAHLVLHRSPHGSLAEIEEEANRFAAEFLLPEEAMRREIIPPVTLLSLAKLKPRWGVSIQALVYRAYQLNIIAERQYRYLFEQISKQGWRKEEPSNLAIPAEKPRLLRKLAEHSFGNPLDVEKMANLTKLPVSLVKAILEVHADQTEMAKSQKSKATPSISESKQENGKLLKFADAGKNKPPRSS